MVSPFYHSNKPKAKPSPANIQSLELLTIPYCCRPSLQVRLVNQQLLVSISIILLFNTLPISLSPPACERSQYIHRHHNQIHVRTGRTKSQIWEDGIICLAAACSEKVAKSRTVSFPLSLHFLWCSTLIWFKKKIKKMQTCSWQSPM